MESFSQRLLTVVFAKRYTLDVWQSSEYVSAYSYTLIYNQKLKQ